MVSYYLNRFKDQMEDQLSNIKYITKSLATETNSQLKVFETKLHKLHVPELDRIDEKLQFFEQEIVNLKNMSYKAAMIKNESKTGQNYGSMGVAENILDLKTVSEELDEISLFIQRFADSHVSDQLRVIKDPDSTIKQKMDTLDWLARNSEFISTDSISNCLKEFKELYSNHNILLKNEYINSRNHSLAVINILQQIEHTTKLDPSDDTDYKISVLYSILEPLLINNYNLEKAVDMEIIDTIMRSLKQSLNEMPNYDPKESPGRSYMSKQKDKVAQSNNL